VQGLAARHSRLPHASPHCSVLLSHAAAGPRSAIELALTTYLARVSESVVVILRNSTSSVKRDMSNSAASTWTSPSIGTAVSRASSRWCVP